MTKAKIAIVGYGNLGRHAIQAITQSPDMEVAGIVRRQADGGKIQGIPTVSDIKELGSVDVALLCVPSLKVQSTAQSYLQQGIATIDSFDVHGQPIWDLKNQLNTWAKQGQTASITAAGWDPGIDSVLRAAFKVAVPVGVTYTNYGPGMSMGHSVAARSATGVADAISVTYPLGSGQHRRLVYVKLKPGADAAAVHNEIAAMDYFKNDPLVFQVVDNLDDVRDCGHGMLMERKGIAGMMHNQQLSCTFRINNPAVTTQIMVMAARAVLRQKPGCYTMLEVPPCDFFAESLETIVKTMV